MNAIQPKGILIGLATFAVLYIGVTFLSNIIVRAGGPQDTLLWLNSLAFFTWVASGYIVGVFAKSKGIINGALFGLFSIVVVSLAQYIFGGAAGFKNAFNGYGFFYWIGIGVLLGGLGGLLW